MQMADVHIIQQGKPSKMEKSGGNPGDASCLRKSISQFFFTNPRLVRVGFFVHSGATLAKFLAQNLKTSK